MLPILLLELFVNFVVFSGTIKELENCHISEVATEVEVDNVSDDDVIEVVRDDAPIEILSDGEELELEIAKHAEHNKILDGIVENCYFTSLPSETQFESSLKELNNVPVDPLTNPEMFGNLGSEKLPCDTIAHTQMTTESAVNEKTNQDDSDENHYVNVTDFDHSDNWSMLLGSLSQLGCDQPHNSTAQQNKSPQLEYNNPEQLESLKDNNVDPVSVNNKDIDKPSSNENDTVDIAINNLTIDNATIDNRATGASVSENLNIDTPCLDNVAKDKLDEINDNANVDQ